MKVSDFKFKVKPWEIVVVIASIIVISISVILIKNYVKKEELNNLSIAGKTQLEDGDTVIQVDDNSLNTAEISSDEKNNQQVQETTPKSNADNKIVIKKGSTAVVQIPSLGILAQVTEGSDPGTLKNYVGVVEGSSRPGQVGNYVLAAHNNIDTEIFKNLHKIENGALVNIYTQSKMYTYKIEDKYNVKPTQTEVLDKSKNKKEITLITCNYNATERIIVKGVLVSEKIARNVTQ